MSLLAQLPLRHWDLFCNVCVGAVRVCMHARRTLTVLFKSSTQGFLRHGEALQLVVRSWRDNATRGRCTVCGERELRRGPDDILRWIGKAVKLRRGHGVTFQATYTRARGWQRDERQMGRGQGVQAETGSFGKEIRHRNSTTPEAGRDI
jgi:hypothetical protein